MTGTSDIALGEHLLADGSLRREALIRAQEYQLMVGGRLDSVLLELGLAREPALLDALSRVHHTPPVTAAELETIEPEVPLLISPRIAARFQVVPFRREGKRISVAMVEPGDLFIEDELALLTGCMISSFVALEVRLVEVMARLYGVELPPLLVSVSRRLRSGSGARPALSPEPAPPGSKPRPPAEDRPGQAVFMPSAVQVSGPTQALPSELELELSEEDLELFPSLRDAPAGATDARPTAPTDPVVESPASHPREPAVLPSLADDLSPEARLALVSAALENAEMRDDIADALLAFCAPYLSRRALLTVRKDVVVGWRGDGVNPDTLRQISIPLVEPSIFVGLTRGQTFWLGSLPPMPRNAELIQGLGGVAPRDCVVLPITLLSRTVCFLYGDNVTEGVGGVPVALLRRLGAKASVAFQVYLLKGKIRTL